MASARADQSGPRPDPPSGDAVFVEAPARLHFGMLDLRGALGRTFGGIGAAIPAPALRLEAERAPTIDAVGPSADRVAETARRVLAHYGLTGGARFRVHAAIPPHAGLGSGTQLSLAVSRALAELYALPTDAPTLARVVGRAQRSAIGTWIFALGGFVLEGGRRPGSASPAPLLARYDLPTTWRCVVAIPPGTSGLSGDAESEAFAHLPPPPEHSVTRVAHLVLMALLPALVEGDLPAFGSALTEIQCINGRWFAPAQGGPFSPGPSTRLIERMTEWGAVGVGQSSWGPAVYGIVDGDATAHGLADRVRAELGPSSGVFMVPFANSGARIWRGALTRD